MDVLSYSHAYYGGGHHAGGETTLHDIMRLLKDEGNSTYALLSKPHKDGTTYPYDLDGVYVTPFTSKIDPELWFPRVDVVLTHLECALRAGLISPKYGVPVGHLTHNDQPYCIKAAEKGADFLVHNTHWVKEKYDHLSIPSVVLHPIVEPTRYRVPSSREYITLINLSDGSESEMSYDKGARTFYELARRNPHLQFLGVKGAYGTQLIEDLPNVTIWEHQHNINAVYRVTKVLLTPSKYESYGRSPVEAACSGIPAIVTRGQPGLVEAMGSSAAYAAFGDYDEWEYQLDSVLDYYESDSHNAERRSLENWSRSLEEWKDFTKLLKEVVNGSNYTGRTTNLPRIRA